jgi:2-polyprenyl-3-methyl-5-hydroxy-6-metoxy-1,4-benzoquinol methylase
MLENTVAVARHMRTRPRPYCCLCRAKGNPLHLHLTDDLFGVPGEWSFRQCPDRACGLIWLDPMPLEEDIGLAYQSYHTHEDSPAKHHARSWGRRLAGAVKTGYLARRYGYGADTLSPAARWLGGAAYLDVVRRAWLDRQVMYLPARPAGRLLDVGCGNGGMMQRLAELGWQAEGVDFDPDAVQQARARGLPVRLGALHHQAYPDEHFDAITMTHVVEHVPDPLALLRESHRILRPGGRLALVTPNADSLGHKLFRDAWRGLEPPRHLHVFQRSALRTLVHRAGFAVLSTSTAIPGADTILLESQAIRLTRRGHSPGRQPAALRLWARGMQLAEWALSPLRSDLGEELVLVAQK